MIIIVYIYIFSYRYIILFIYYIVLVNIILLVVILRIYLNHSLLGLIMFPSEIDYIYVHDFCVNNHYIKLFYKFNEIKRIKIN